eukprot:TRINITY_DN1919_c0_g1_i2.p1 TRINITY_DN1919_c0_g1~~TRINITY_DN1919_c0_g1_i2.p1  ORF type:complete len:891 (+),score=144.28 TRINITY_DN1919_c0_g1_i2:120-2792(+)
MNSKDYCSALVVTPPKALWTLIQEVRSKHDKAYNRWMPHINLIYPFAPSSENIKIRELIQNYLDNNHVSPFEISFPKSSIGEFQHGPNSFTLVLFPQCSPSDSLQHLQSGLASIFPYHDDLSKINPAKGFTPHLTLGQFQNKSSLQQFKRSLEAKWPSDMKWKVQELYLINRTHSGPFETALIFTIPSVSDDISPLAWDLPESSSSSWASSDWGVVDDSTSVWGTPATPEPVSYSRGGSIVSRGGRGGAVRGGAVRGGAIGGTRGALAGMRGSRGGAIVGTRGAGLGGPRGAGLGGARGAGLGGPRGGLASRGTAIRGRGGVSVTSTRGGAVARGGLRGKTDISKKTSSTSKQSKAPVEQDFGFLTEPAEACRHIVILDISKIEGLRSVADAQEKEEPYTPLSYLASQLLYGNCIGEETYLFAVRGGGLKNVKYNPKCGSCKKSLHRPFAQPGKVRILHYVTADELCKYYKTKPAAVSPTVWVLTQVSNVDILRNKQNEFGPNFRVIPINGDAQDSLMSEMQYSGAVGEIVTVDSQLNKMDTGVQKQLKADTILNKVVMRVVDWLRQRKDNGGELPKNKAKLAKAIVNLCIERVEVDPIFLYDTLDKKGFLFKCGACHGIHVTPSGEIFARQRKDSNFSFAWEQQFAAETGEFKIDEQAVMNDVLERAILSLVTNRTPPDNELRLRAFLSNFDFKVKVSPVKVINELEANYWIKMDDGSESERTESSEVDTMDIDPTDSNPSSLASSGDLVDLFNSNQQVSTPSSEERTNPFRQNKDKSPSTGTKYTSSPSSFSFTSSETNSSSSSSSSFGWPSLSFGSSFTSTYTTTTGTTGTTTSSFTSTTTTFGSSYRKPTKSSYTFGVKKTTTSTSSHSTSLQLPKKRHEKLVYLI